MLSSKTPSEKPATGPLTSAPGLRLKFVSHYATLPGSFTNFYACLLLDAVGILSSGDIPPASGGVDSIPFVPLFFSIFRRCSNNT